MQTQAAHAERTSHAALLEALQTEIDLARQQLRKSRAARGIPTDSTADPAREPRQPMLELDQRAAAFRARSLASLTPAHPDPDPASSSSPLPHHPRPTAAEEDSPSNDNSEGPPLPERKEGYLGHLAPAGFSDGDLARRYFVVDRGGVRWYESEEHRRQDPPRRALGTVAFSVTTTNSRGSVFRRAAVCWPLLLPEDSPQVARHPGPTYFAVDYYAPQGLGARIVSGGGGGDIESRKLILATASPAARDEWVRFLRQFIDIYLAPRAESEELQYLLTGGGVAGGGASASSPGGTTAGSRTPSRPPVYRSEVLDGEAPGGKYL